MKSKQSKKSAKKAPAAKKKSAAKKKPVQKSAKSSKQSDGKKSSGISYDKAVKDCMDLQKGLGSQLLGLLLRGFPKRDIQIVIRYKTIGGVVEHRGTKELE